jgi:CBS domain-containing protein
MSLLPFSFRVSLVSYLQQSSAARVYQTFLALGLRHLCVTTNRGDLQGVITRKDLDLFAERRGAGKR